MARADARIEHLLRRAGFGATRDAIDRFADMGYVGAVEQLVEIERVPDWVDSAIGQAGYVRVTVRSEFLPNRNITDARQRWLFRMVHTGRPLQEKMALFWHNHFATGYSKIAGAIGAEDAARTLAAKPTEDPGQMRGQLELIRQYALGNFRDLLVEMSKDVAMLYWLDGRSNTRARPQENYARELLELFTLGVGHFSEADVLAAARVFTGWNVRRVDGPTGRTDPASRYEFFYNAAQHDTAAKTFTFPIYPDGSRTIPARNDGMQDGLDLINALARHPETARRLARRLFAFFVSDISEAPSSFVDRIASTYLQTGYNMREVVRAVLLSPEFLDESSRFARFAWPVEYVARALQEVGYEGFSVNDALTPLANMGQTLFEPPNVSGWKGGRAWFSSATTLARMNFASQLAVNQRTRLRDEARAHASTPQAVLSWMLDKLSLPRLDQRTYDELIGYLHAGISWTGSDAQLQVKVPGLTHLILGSADYQLV